MRKSYFSKDDIRCSNFLVLANNGIFFYAGSCEDDVALSKGYWRIKGHKLYLKGWDSLKSYPKVRVDLLRGDTTESIKITATDYFGKPFNTLALELIAPNDFRDYKLPDSLGQFKVSKKDFKGFFIYFQSGHKDSKFYAFENNLTEVRIHIDFASQAGLDRPAFEHPFGKWTYLIKGNILYSKEGELIYKENKD